MSEKTTEQETTTSKRRLFVFYDEELEKIGVEGETTKQKENSLRDKLELPHRVKNTQKSKLLAKLGLEKGATHKEVMTAMAKELQVE